VTEMVTSSGDVRYPIGRAPKPQFVSGVERGAMISAIEQLPGELRTAVAQLSEDQLDTPYRDGGWTIRQIVHHLPDSHANAYVRMRLALTESSPVIKPYAEDLWAELPDAKTAKIEMSLGLIEHLHARWTALLKALSDEQFGRTFRHPELGEQRIDQALALYSWHGRHHIAQVIALRERLSWR
jgi:uncharacterized damage-inducible protein DinB